MALNWSTKEGSPARLTASQENMGGFVQAACFTLMAVGISKVTEENAPEVYARFRLYESLFGPMLVRLGENGQRDDGFKRADVQSLIGLSTNVTNEGKAKWTKRVTETYLVEEAKNYLRSYPAKAD